MKFIDYLINVVEATSFQKKTEQWDVQGILKNKYNELYKFDTRPIQKTKEGEIGKYSSFNTKADKMVFESDDQWIILDVNELHRYLKEKQISNSVYLQSGGQIYWKVS